MRPAGISAANGSGVLRCGACAGIASLDAEEGGEVEPLKERVHQLEAVAPEEIHVFVQPIRNEHVLQRLTLATDFRVGISSPSFEFVVEIDEKAVHVAI